MRHIATIVLVLSVLATGSRVEAARASLQVRVYDVTMMPAADQTAALRAAAGVLAAAGIDITWVACGERGDAANAPSCEAALAPAELSVRFVRLPAEPSARGQLQLGYSLVNTSTRDGTLATVYVDRVEWLASQAGADGAVVLGFAVAHELGHLLLGTNAHARSGLMRAVWSRTELQHGHIADWLVSRDEAARMRASLAERNGLRSSEHDATRCAASLRDGADGSAGCGGTTALAALRGLAPGSDR